MTFLESLGIYGWDLVQENLLLTSILTGDPLLMIGKHGSAKTATAYAVSRALGVEFISYDASKAMFDDVLGYPNPKELVNGKITYVQSPLTIWDKEFILVDEINRPIYEMQSKWLEIIRSRRIMGFPTKVKWVWAAMNPASYVATKQLDDALIGRFAYFLYVPDFMDMDEEHRISITQHINGDDAPAMNYWKPDFEKTRRTLECQENLRETMEKAAFIFANMKQDSDLIAEFVSKYSELLKRDTQGKLVIDGRRAGFIQRAITASKAISLARGDEAIDTFDLVKNAVISSLPLGLNSDAGRDADLENIALNTVCFFNDMFKGEVDKLYDVYEMLTTKDILRKLKLMLRTDLNELARVSAWQEVLDKKEDKNFQDQISILAYCALSVEAAKPGVVPQEMLTKLKDCVDLGTFDPAKFPPLVNLNTQYAFVVSNLVNKKKPVEALIACGVAKQFLKNLSRQDDVSLAVAEQRDISQDDLEKLKLKIASEIKNFYDLVEEHQLASA